MHGDRGDVASDVVLVLAVPLAGRDLTKGAYLLVLSGKIRQECAVFCLGAIRAGCGWHARSPRGGGQVRAFFSMVMSMFVKE